MYIINIQPLTISNTPEIVDSSEKIDYEELFVKGISINNHFTFSYKNDMLGIRLMYKDSSVHVVFDFIKLLEELV